MDQAHDTIPDTSLERIKVREVAGVFRSRRALDDAVDAPLRAGCDRADIDLMAGIDALRERLGGVHVPAGATRDPPKKLPEFKYG